MRKLELTLFMQQTQLPWKTAASYAADGSVFARIATLGRYSVNTLPDMDRPTEAVVARQ